MRPLLFLIAVVPSLATACDACRDADAAKQSFMSSIAPPPAAEPQASAPEVKAVPRDRASTGEPSIGGTSEIVPAGKPRVFIRSFNELK